MGGDLPDLFLQIQLIPSRSEYFTGPARGQNGQLHCFLAEVIMLSDFFHEGWHLNPRQGRGMTHGCNLRAGREQFIEVSTPMSRVSSR
jgi:hypothetical protein